MVDTFCPTVGTVLPDLAEGGASPVDPEAGSPDAEVVSKTDLIWFSNVVLPALSRPSRIIEYSGHSCQQAGVSPRVCQPPASGR